MRTSSRIYVFPDILIHASVTAVTHEWYKKIAPSIVMLFVHCVHYWVNSSPPGQNGPHFADNIFRCIFQNEKFCIFIKISPKFVSKGPIDNNKAIGSDNDLAPNRHQAITWTKDGLGWWHIYASLSLNKLTCSLTVALVVTLLGVLRAPPASVWRVTNVGGPITLGADTPVLSNILCRAVGSALKSPPAEERIRSVVGYFCTGYGYDSLWSGDATWWQQSGSTLVYVMACWLMATQDIFPWVWKLLIQDYSCITHGPMT